MLYDVIPPEMWVFYPAADGNQVIEYKQWCVDNLGYVPYIDANIVIFNSADDTVWFKLSHPNLI